MMDLAAARFWKAPPIAHTIPIGPRRNYLRSKRKLEQVHICIGVPAFPMADQRRFAVSVLNNLLGGGMSSRLFQNIREKQGLAYAIFSELNSYRDAGSLSVYAGTSLETARKLMHPC